MRFVPTRRRLRGGNAAFVQTLTTIEFDPALKTLPQNNTLDLRPYLIGRDQNTNVMSIVDPITWSEIAPVFDIAAQSGYYDRLRATAAPGVHDDLISSWTTDGGRVMTQSLTLRPKKQIIGGVHSVLFDGSNDYIDLTGITVTHPWTSYMVMKILRAGTFERFFEALNGTAHGAFLTVNNTPTIGIYGPGAGPALVGATAPLIGEKGIMTMTFSNSAPHLRWNTLTAVTSGSMAGGLAPTGIRLGADTTPAAYSNFHLYDWVIRLGADNATVRDNHRIALGWLHQVAA